MNDNLYKMFLEHMHELENFRMSYAAMHPSTPLDRDDPDVRRLTEAMAYFSARTHLAGRHNIVGFRRRIFQQFFAYLLTPLPAMGMVRANPTQQFGEPVLLPGGTEFAVSSETRGAALFRTLSDIRLLPIELDELKMLLLPNKGRRVLLEFEAVYARSDDIGELQLYIDHLNDYQASLRIRYALEKHLRRAMVIFNEKANEESRGAPCMVSYGSVENADDSYFPHPLQKERSFFHFPQQELFIRLTLPRPPRNWRRFTICLDLDDGWPRSMMLNKDAFQLFTVPVVNLNQSMAQPVLCDGTRERYSIRHPEPEYGYDLHSVIGVYKVEDNAMVPVRAGILSGGSGSYELEESDDSSGKKRHLLNLHFPEAFEDPKTIVTDALWLQSWFSETLHEKIQASPFSRQIAGVRWDLLGDIVPHADNTFQKELEGFLHLLTLKNKSVLDFDDITGMLRTLGSVHQGQFKPALDLLSEVEMEETQVMQRGSRGLLKQIYRFRFKEFDTGMLPLVETFVVHLERILDVWISEATVEARMKVSPTDSSDIA